MMVADHCFIKVVLLRKFEGRLFFWKKKEKKSGLNVHGFRWALQHRYDFILNGC
jgi:dolichol-phosphate mannosyltransferase